MSSYPSNEVKSLIEDVTLEFKDLSINLGNLFEVNFDILVDKLRLIGVNCGNY